MEAERDARIRQLQNMAGEELARSGAGLAYDPAFAAPQPLPVGSTAPDQSMQSIVPDSQVVARGATADGRAWEQWDSGATAYAVPRPVLDAQELPPLSNAQLAASAPASSATNQEGVGTFDRLVQSIGGTGLGLAQSVAGAARFVNDQGWVLANGLTDGWLAENNADALAAVQRNTALGQALSEAPGAIASDGLRLAMGNVSLDEIGQGISAAWQSDRIDQLNAAGDFAGAQAIRTQNVLGIASLAVGGEGLVAGAADASVSLARTAAMGTRLAAAELADSRTAQLAGAMIEKRLYQVGAGPVYMMPPDFTVAPPESGPALIDLSASGDVAPGFYRANPAQLRFTQSDASPFFSKGGTIDNLVADLRSGKVTPDQVGDPLQVVMHDGVPFSIDNRRLVAFNTAGIDNVPIQVVSLEDPAVAARFFDRFDSIGGTGQNIVITPSSGRTAAQQLLKDFGLIKGVQLGN
ncbi:hypothetical protein ACI2UZ_08050 [Ralstonia nicotianae]|uniref:hypothetical protein n=1 Tax=Ralstonia pseudosolanacearum TaxID=1310165 RepID=UPI000CE4EAC8|nr:hypothetical protein [Ralstonia pseudosolanacearum]MBX9432000.1 hypothetical protein [Ralstonia pseudosolanacearum]MCF1441355.1 hypothetical protein [Ralstonia solanacearum]